MTRCRFSTHWLLWSLVGASCIGLGLWGRGYSSQQALLQQLMSNAQQQGLAIEIGRVQRGPFATKLQNLQLRLKNAAGVSVSIGAVEIRGAFFGAPRAVLKQVQFSLVGEPSDLFASLTALARTPDRTVALENVSASYSHKIFGKLTFEGVSLEVNGGISVVRAARVELGASRWQDVVFAVQRRNQVIEVGLLNSSIESAPIRLGYFPSTRDASQWTVTATHQPARTLARRAGWDPGAAFDNTSIVGSLSLIVPDDPKLKVRGSMQWVLDRWPNPGWADAEALLGSTLSLAARIEPAEDMASWQLPDVELSLPIFSLTGVGRVRLGNNSALVLDVRGSRNCAQLEAHLPESTHRKQIQQYLEATSTAADVVRSRDNVPAIRRREEVELRLQVAVESASTEPAQLAWQLVAGCGLPVLQQGAFKTLDLPEFVRKRRNAATP